SRRQRPPARAASVQPIAHSSWHTSSPPPSPVAHDLPYPQRRSPPAGSATGRRARRARRRIVDFASLRASTGRKLAEKGLDLLVDPIALHLGGRDHAGGAALAGHDVW